MRQGKIALVVPRVVTGKGTSTQDDVKFDKERSMEKSDMIDDDQARNSEYHFIQEGMDW